MSKPVAAVARRSIHIALEELNFVWSEDHLKYFRLMWGAGCSVKKIAEYFKRDPDEVLLLAIDQARDGKIQRRPYGLLSETENLKNSN